ncbi:glycosyltransferase [Arthrobacter sp. MDT2-2]
MLPLDYHYASAGSSSTNKVGVNLPGLILHEWIARHGGSENVVAALLDGFPDAELACLWNDAPDRFASRRVTESVLAKTGLRRHKAGALPIMPLVWKTIRLPAFDWLLISSHAFAHQAADHAMRRDVPAFVYAHTPARYLWAPTLDERSRHPLAKMGAMALRHIDSASVVKTATFAANSNFVAERMNRAWGVDAQTIYPPIAIERLHSRPDWSQELDEGDSLTLQELPTTFVLGASRFVKYKQLERVIRLGELCNLPVVLAGSGPEHAALLARAATASVPVSVVLKPSDKLLYALYERATLFAFPPVEDFGIMPVEAMALGTPTIVNELGGAAESVRIVEGGVTASWHDDDALRSAVDQALSLDMTAARANSARFSEASFVGSIKRWMDLGPQE